MKDRKKPSKEKISHFKIALSSWEVCKYSWSHIMPVLLPYGQIRNNTGSSCAIYVTHSLLRISIWAKIQRKRLIRVVQLCIHTRRRHKFTKYFNVVFPLSLLYIMACHIVAKARTSASFSFRATHYCWCVCVCVSEIKSLKWDRVPHQTYRMSMRCCCVCPLTLKMCLYN